MHTYPTTPHARTHTHTHTPSQTPHVAGHVLLSADRARTARDCRDGRDVVREGAVGVGGGGVGPRGSFLINSLMDCGGTPAPSGGRTHSRALGGEMEGWGDGWGVRGVTVNELWLRQQSQVCWVEGLGFRV